MEKRPGGKQWREGTKIRLPLGRCSPDFLYSYRGSMPFDAGTLRWVARDWGRTSKFLLADKSWRCAPLWRLSMTTDMANQTFRDRASICWGDSDHASLPEISQAIETATFFLQGMNRSGRGCGMMRGHSLTLDSQWNKEWKWTVSSADKVND